MTCFNQSSDDYKSYSLRAYLYRKIINIDSLNSLIRDYCLVQNKSQKWQALNNNKANNVNKMKLKFNK